MDTNFEQITPWNGANDTGRDVRMKWQRNFDRVAAALKELLSALDVQGDALDEIIGELENFLRKDREDQTEYLVKFLGGLVTDRMESQGFTSGPFGTGFVVKRDPETGRSYAEIDELYVRLKAYFESLGIKHLSHIGGRFVASPAGMECIRVETVTAEYENLYDSAGLPITDSDGEEVKVPKMDGEQAYRCYFKQTDGERDIVNEFDLDDLAQCREFNVKAGTSNQVGNQYYWRKVIGVGEDYIDLSVTDCDAGSGVPRAGDSIVTIGNKTKPERQHVVLLSSFDNDAPYFKLYTGINSYSMEGKEVTVVSPNAEKNLFTGKVVIKPGSTGFSNFDDAPDPDEIDRKIEAAKEEANQAAAAAQKDANAAKQQVSDLGKYVDGAFKDGIITEAEAKAIATYLNTVNSAKKEMDATYDALYSNTYLTETYKQQLQTAKTTFDTAITNLTSAINTAIADGKTTAAEKDTVDKRFATFNDAYASLSTAIGNANKSIQDKLKQEAIDQAKSDLSDQIGEVDSQVKDAIAKQLGYADFDELKSYAERGMTIISGGTINTKVIETSLLITSQLIANAIMTNTLNVNNKFKVFTDGSVDMNGIFRSLGEKTELVLSNGYLRIMYNGNDVMLISVDERTGAPTINMNYDNKRFFISPDQFTFRMSDGRMLTFDPETINRSGQVMANPDGFLYVASSQYNYITAYIRVSPSNGGSALPFVGSAMKLEGSTDTLKAIPADGYEFDHWSDGGSQTHDITWSGSSYTFTAYFTKKEDAEFTVTLKASPTGGGTVSGGGTYANGTKRTVQATPNDGYRFVRWSDGGYQSHQVTWDSNKTLTAYFEEYTVTGEELLSGTDLTDDSYWEAYGDASIVLVFNGTAVLSFGSDENSTEVVFNRHYLGGKIQQGHKYLLKFKAQSSKATSITGGIGESVWGGEMITAFIAEITEANSFKTFEIELDALYGDSTTEMGLIFYTIDCILYIKELSLKEI